MRDLRGAKAPLYHGAAGFREFFCILLNSASAVQLIGESFQNFCWLGALGVIGVSGSIEDGLVSIHDECRRSGQLPAFISIGKRQIDERAAVNFLLILRDPVDKAELAAQLGFHDRSARGNAVYAGRP